MRKRYRNALDMSLEIDKISPQVEDLAKEIIWERGEQAKAAKLARDSFLKLEPERQKLEQKLREAKSTWLIAEPIEKLDSFPACSPPPSEYSAIGADGSHLVSERYSYKPYYLINLGVSLLSYGKEPDADLSSSPKLYFKKEEMAVKDPSGRERDVPIVGPLLGMKRQVEETTCVVKVLSKFKSHNAPLLGMLDGSLTLFGLETQNYPSFVHKAMLDDGLIKAFRLAKEVNESNPATPKALVSYISAPGSSEVVNLLRLYLCPHEPVNCDRFCREKQQGEKECDVISAVTDRTLFSMLLRSGERSPLFGSRSSIMQYYGEHRVCFFYMKLDEEVARVEMPEWLSGLADSRRQTVESKQEITDSKQQKSIPILDLVHSMVLDQCRRGVGYPVALSEAHERAVLRSEDRRILQSMLEEFCLEGDLTPALNAKDLSKKTRWI